MRNRAWMRLASAAALLAVAAACAPAAAERPHRERPVVASTFTVLADMVRAIGGDDVEAVSVLEPGAEVHSYQPTPGDLRRLASADLVVDNGFGLEHWFERFRGNSPVPRVEATRAVTPIPIEGTDAPNPHAWVSPRESGAYVDAIAEALAALRPEAAGRIAERAADYHRQLDALDRELVAAVASIPAPSRRLVTCEGAFSYLARDYGLGEGYLWAVNGAQPSAKAVGELVQDVRARRVPAVFCESTVPDTTMRRVADESGARFAGTFYVDSLSEPDGPVPTHLDLLRHDVRTLTEGLAA